jgi:hypothetical protein
MEMFTENTKATESRKKLIFFVIRRFLLLEFIYGIFLLYYLEVNNKASFNRSLTSSLVKIVLT